MNYIPDGFLYLEFFFNATFLYCKMKRQQKFLSSRHKSNFKIVRMSGFKLFLEYKTDLYDVCSQLQHHLIQMTLIVHIEVGLKSNLTNKIIII